MPMTGPIWLWSLLAQGNDAGEWMNILFIVVVAVFWAIGGIVKAAGAGRQKRQRDNQTDPNSRESKRETFFQQLARKAEEFQRAVENQAKQSSRPSRPSEQPAKPGKPPAGRVTMRKGRGGEPVLVYERPTTPPRRQPEKPKAPAPPARAAATPPRVRRDQKPVAEFQPPPADVPAKPHARPTSAQKVTPSATVSSPIIDYSDPDALRRAILHYEILGKPLALRDPLDRMSSF